MSLFRTAAFALLVAAACLCAAKPPFLKVFMATYNIKPNSRLGKTKCLICHRPPGPPNRNPYGRTVKDALMEAEARMVTSEILHSIENKDMGDGVKFIAKIKKGMPPGVSKPEPKRKPKAMKKA